MNANELTDYLLNFIMTVEDYDESKHEKAATMLRQQQAEIKALKAHPVKEQDCYGDGNVYRGVRSKDSEVQTIYFNPAKEHDIGISHAIGFNDGFKAGMQRSVEMNVVKELTDEEITELANEYLYYISHDYEVTGIYKFARAILKKAQEK